MTHQSALAPDEIARHSYHLATRGYSVVENFLDDDFRRALRDAYEPLLLGYKAGLGDRAHLDRHHIHDLLARDAVFGALLEDPRLQQLVEPHLGPHWIMYAFTTSSVPPRGENFGGRVHVDSPRLIPGYPTNIGVIWALDDFTHDNGGTEILPGSHHSPETPDDALFDANHVKLTCPAGSLILFHARAFHRAGANRTGAWRHSLTMNCCRPFMKQRMAWVRLIPADIAAALSPQARRIIGYDTRLPTSLDEFFVPEEQRLYKSNQE